MNDSSSQPEQNDFERLLRESSPDPEVVSLRETATLFGMASLGLLLEPPASVRENVFEQITPTCEAPENLAEVLAASGESLVVANRFGRIEWVNAAFSEMCGYSLSELRGRKPGALLQGPDTDPDCVEKIRAAIRDGKSVCVPIVNYHKDGSPYRVSLSISPILDEQGKVVRFLAVESKLQS